jgi:hypothetical protein
MSTWSSCHRTQDRGPVRLGSSAGRRRRARVLVVIAYRDLDGELHGMNAWPASGRDLATYREGVPDGEET